MDECPVRSGALVPPGALVPGTSTSTNVHKKGVSE